MYFKNEQKENYHIPTRVECSETNIVKTINSFNVLLGKKQTDT